MIGTEAENPGFSSVGDLVDSVILANGNKGIVAFKNPHEEKKKPRPEIRTGPLKSRFKRIRSLRVVNFGSCRHFLELGQGAEWLGFGFAGAAAGGGHEREGGNTDGSNYAEHGGSEMRFLGFREKNNIPGKLQGGPVVRPPCFESFFGKPGSCRDEPLTWTVRRRSERQEPEPGSWSSRKRQGKFQRRRRQGRRFSQVS